MRVVFVQTTWHLVDDLELLREHCMIDRWHTMLGGSWGEQAIARA